MINVHYRTTDGEIFGFDNSLSPIKQNGCEIASFEISPNPKTQKIDLATLQLIEKTAAEQELVNQPTLVDVQSTIFKQLSDTDSFMLPDRPLSIEIRAAWVTYRQALRDLSKLDGPAAMVQAWPTRPDNVDPLLYTLRK